MRRARGQGWIEVFPSPAGGRGWREAPGEGACRAQRSPSVLFLLAATIIVIIILIPGDAHSCSVCGGDPESPIAAGMNNAIWALLGITGSVLSSLAAFFVYLWRRARRVRKTPIDTAWLDGLRGAKNV